MLIENYVSEPFHLLARLDNIPHKMKYVWRVHTDTHCCNSAHQQCAMHSVGFSAHFKTIAESVTSFFEERRIFSKIITQNDRRFCFRRSI